MGYAFKTYEGPGRDDGYAYDLQERACVRVRKVGGGQRTIVWNKRSGEDYGKSQGKYPDQDYHGPDDDVFLLEHQKSG